MKLPNTYNYIAAFLTTNCCYRCSYCVNWPSTCQEVKGEDWVNAFSKLETDLPVTLCGGEPSLHPDFYHIINNLPQKIDILTNLSFDVNEFVKNVDLKKFDNSKQFAPIRASFHSEFMNIEETIDKILVLMRYGFRVGLYCVDCETNKTAIEYFNNIPQLDFQLKPLLDNSVKIKKPNNAKCRIKELIVAPDLKVYKCHRDLYKQEESIGLVTDTYATEYCFRNCLNSDGCHPCDIKPKRDRFGVDNYKSIETFKKVK